MKQKTTKQNKSVDKSTDLFPLEFVDDIPSSNIGDFIHNKGTDAIDTILDMLPSANDILDVAGGTVKVIGNVVGDIIETIGDVSD